MSETEIYPLKLEKHTENYKKAKETLKTAFPKKEQSPFWALTFLSKHPGVDFYTWHNKEGQYLGVSYSIHHNTKLMILYLALEETTRNKGYGTKIIKYLQEKDNIEETVLDIESPHQQAENTPQRLRRQQFYKRLGFYPTNYEIIEPSCNYTIMGTSTSPEHSVEIYEQLTDLLIGKHIKMEIRQRK